MNLHKLVAIVLLAAAAALSSLASEFQVSYFSPIFRMGSSVTDASSMITTSPKLAFPNMTLADIVALADDGYVFCGTQCGTSMPMNRPFQAKELLVLEHPGSDAISMLVAHFVAFDGGHTKSLSVELTDGAGGVYAKAGSAQYLNGRNDTSFRFVFPDGDGGVTYSCDTSDSDKALITDNAEYNRKGYAICALTIAKVPKASGKIRIFANAPGEPTLTVQDIRDYSFSSLFCGHSVATNYVGLAIGGYNTVVEENGSGQAQKLTVDFQINEGNYTKCVVVELTDGEGGVYAQAVNGMYAFKSNLPIGSPSTSEGWTVQSASKPECYGFSYAGTSAYGIFSMKATPPSRHGMYWDAVGNVQIATHNVADVTKLPILTTRWVKVFDGISLQDIVDDGHEISAFFFGGSVTTKQRAYARHFYTYTPAGETSVSNAICSFAIYDTGTPRHTKCVSVLLETRPDGVYARYGKGQYLNSVNNVNFKFAWLDDEGNPVYDCDQETRTATYNSGEPASWGAQGYGVAGIKTSRYMKKNESRLVFANPAGEPVLTLDDIKDHHLGCSFAANNISNNDCQGEGLYRTFERDGDSVRKMQVEFQVYDGGWNKCVIVDFTNGVDGVYGCAVAAGHANHGSGLTGHHFVNEAGEFVNTGDAVVTRFDGPDGYGIYDLFAAPKITLGRDTDWSGSDGVVDIADAVIDLNGHDLTLQGISGNRYRFAQIVNTRNDDISVVRFKVPGGMTSVNDTVRFGAGPEFSDCNIKVVKDGNGAYVAAVGPQCYEGGTEIADGTLKAGVSGSSDPFDKEIVIPSGCAFDINGQLDYGNYLFVLAGGTITNTGADNNLNQALFKTVSLTADSSFLLPRSTGMIGPGYANTTLDLAGHTLTIDITAEKEFLLLNSTVTNGTVELKTTATHRRDGRFRTGISGTSSYDRANHAETVDFKVDCALWLYTSLSVHNYEALYSENSNNGTGALNVYGAFKPSAHDYFRGCTMMDGSTIDLTLREAALPLVSAFTNADSSRTLTFADGAKVYVKTGGKRFAGDKLISWTEKPANVDTLKFLVAPGDPRCVLVAKDDGLYAVTGFKFIIR